jgi:hypothetical protein
VIQTPLLPQGEEQGEGIKKAIAFRTSPRPIRRKSCRVRLAAPKVVEKLITDSCGYSQHAFTATLI